MSKKLTPKQEQFCQEYMVDLNATQAAIRAGYSKKTAKVIACELMGKPHIAERIAELKKERVEGAEIKAAEVVQVLKQWIYSDITDTLNLTVDELRALPPDVRRLIHKVKLETNENGVEVCKEVVMIDKVRAADMLMKHTKGYHHDEGADGEITINRKRAN